jgi:hypothetical protein
METTVLTIQSGNDSFYFDQNTDGTVRLCKNEKYINTFSSIGTAFESYYGRNKAVCIDLRVARIETESTNRTYLL